MPEQQLWFGCIAALRRFVLLWLLFSLLAVQHTLAVHEATVFGWK